MEFSLWQEESYEVSEDTVEMDELNSHECMAKMSALLKHLVQNKISPEQRKVVTPLAHVLSLLRFFKNYLAFLSVHSLKTC